MSNVTESRRLFDVPAQEVVAGVPCTWCGAALGAECAERDSAPGIPHAQRWRDYWNATHDRGERVAVYPAPWRISL
jgi:hypothetical protein